MDLGDLRSAQRAAREEGELRHLPDEFYREAAAYAAELERTRDDAVEAADDPWNDPEVRRLTDELEAARNVLRGLFERRVAKVVRRATIEGAEAPDTADADGAAGEATGDDPAAAVADATDDEPIDPRLDPTAPMTPEERELFDRVREAVRTARRDALGDVGAGGPAGPDEGDTDGSDEGDAAGDVAGGSDGVEEADDPDGAGT